jgi:hypothetical protein
MKIEYVKNLQWEDAEHTIFSCIVKYEQFTEELPSGVNGVDQTPYIREIWQKANDGFYGVIAEFIAPPEPEPEKVVIDSTQPTVVGAQTL